MSLKFVPFLRYMVHDVGKPPNGAVQMFELSTDWQGYIEIIRQRKAWGRRARSANLGLVEVVPVKGTRHGVQEMARLGA